MNGWAEENAIKAIFTGTPNAMSHLKAPTTANGREAFPSGLAVENLVFSSKL
jgi:hypothetical protein